MFSLVFSISYLAITDSLPVTQLLTFFFIKMQLQ